MGVKKGQKGQRPKNAHIWGFFASLFSKQKSAGAFKKVPEICFTPV